MNASRPIPPALTQAQRREVKRSSYVHTPDPLWLANGRGRGADIDAGTDYTHWDATYNRTTPWQGPSCDEHDDYAFEADVSAAPFS